MVKRDCSILLILLFLTWLIAGGCRRVENTLYLKYMDISSNGWQRNKPLCFEPAAADTFLRGSLTDMTLNVRYKSSAPLPPLRLIAVAEDESGELMCDTLHVELFDSEGHTLATQHHGVCETSIPLMNRLPLRNKLSVCLLPISEPDLTIGIVNIGIKLSAHESDTITSPAP